MDFLNQDFLFTNNLLPGLVLVTYILVAIALIAIWKDKKVNFRKLFWTLFIVIAPLVGVLAYFVLRKKTRKSTLQ